MTQTAHTPHYFRSHQIERGGPWPDRRPAYHWVQGYQNIGASGLPIFPCITYREAQREARARGLKAVFHESEADARAAIAKATGKGV